MKIVFLDVKTIGEDIDLSAYDELGEVVKYSFSSPKEVPARVTDADVIILNKVPINEQTIGTAKNLKLVCVTATGTNNLDKEYLDSKGIAWRNVAGYSTETVAQHTFAMLLFLLEKLRYYDDYVKEERYVNDVSFTHFAEHFTEIHGKTWGIIGLGAIGRRVAEIARAFGAKVIYYSASGAPAQEGYEQVDFDTLLAQSDIISVHAPLNGHTEGLIDSSAFGKMKSSCIFLNLGRGPIVDEEALFQVMSLCYSPNRAVNEMLMWAIRMIKGPTSTITKTFAENTLLNQHLLQGKKLDDKEIFRQFFAAVCDNKEEGDNLGEELLGICLYLLTQLLGEPDGKFCLMTDDKGAAGKINSMFKKTPENYRRKRMIFYSTPKLAMLLYKEKYITDQDTLIKMLHTAAEGNMKILGTQIYDLRSREISLTREELAEQIILNRIHVTF